MYISNKYLKIQANRRSYSYNHEIHRKIHKLWNPVSSRHKKTLTSFFLRGPNIYFIKVWILEHESFKFSRYQTKSRLKIVDVSLNCVCIFVFPSLQFKPILFSFFHFIKKHSRCCVWVCELSLLDELRGNWLPFD